MYNRSKSCCVTFLKGVHVLLVPVKSICFVLSDLFCAGQLVIVDYYFFFPPFPLGVATTDHPFPFIQHLHPPLHNNRLHILPHKICISPPRPPSRSPTSIHPQHPFPYVPHIPPLYMYMPKPSRPLLPSFITWMLLTIDKAKYLKLQFTGTVEPRYNEDLGTMTITL